MAIPITYNMRNLVVRKTTTLMTAVGIALTVAGSMAIEGCIFSNGMSRLSWAALIRSASVDGCR